MRTFPATGSTAYDRVNGANYERLAGVKARYHPGGVSRVHQSIDAGQG
jgi:Berberine and berberine like